MRKLVLVFPMLILFLAFGTLPEKTLQSAGQGVTAPQTSPTAVETPPPCDGKYFPKKKAAPGACCQEGIDIYQVIGQSGGLGHRVIGTACTVGPGPDGRTRTYGPCGVAIVPTSPQAQGTDVKIFKPHILVNVCGHQVMPFNRTQPVFYPEQYDNQLLYPPVTPTCPFTFCDGAKPVVRLNVSVSAGTTLGRVTSSPAGIKLSGAARASGLFSGDATLTAEPTSKHARAVFSGDCKKSGEYGEKADCLVKLAPDPKVTVSFECEKGFTCARGKD